MAFLLALLGPLGAFIATFIKAMKPPIAVVEAEKAGAAESALSTAEAHNAEVERTAAAVNAVDDAIATDDGLRKYEQSDPNNLDR